MTSKLRAVQEEARELIRDSIVEDAISRFIAQILEVAAKDRADRLAATLARADALEAALKRTEANRDAAMEDAAEEYARAERAEALLAEAVEALAKAQWSLQPFSDCVFNDNGDITVTVSDRVTSADCLTDAHFAYKRIRATLTRIQEATK